MAKKLVIIIISAILFSTIPNFALGLEIPDSIGTGSEAPGSLTKIACVGPWTKLICVVKKVTDVIDTISDISKTIFGWIPHFFPFGGPILSSERACSLHFRSTTWIGVNIAGFWFPIPGAFPVNLGLSGRAIDVGPPVPTNGKIISFPWISKIYQNHTENRAGPWALGLGFTPFPLDEINDSLGDIHIWIPPTLVDRSCLIPDALWYGRVGFLAQCFDDFSYECVASGETDSGGNDVYKVIRRLGTSPNDVPQSTIDSLRSNFSGFPWP